MYRNKKIGVVVPAYNEEELISTTLKGIPDYIDSIYVINDCSTDNTGSIVRTLADQDPRIVPINHEKNRGVGAAIVNGYLRSIDDKMDITAVMAGDDQMDPKYLPNLLDPIVDGYAGYTKGNRLFDLNYKKGMSFWRLSGNTILTILTKFASGCYCISDPQNGYTAISRQALISIDPNQIFTWYGYCNDIIMRLNAKKCIIVDVPIPARYGNEKSKIRYPVYMARISKLLVNNFITRMAIRRASGNKAVAFLIPLSGCLLIIFGFLPIVLMAGVPAIITSEIGFMAPSIVLVSLPFLGAMVLLYNSVVNGATKSLRKKP
jgi:glycosyltransferase involved in cell wall biosynthesis